MASQHRTQWYCQHGQESRCPDQCSRNLEPLSVSRYTWTTKTRKARRDPPIHHAVYHRRGTRPTLSISLKGGPSIQRDGFWLHTSTGSRLLGIKCNLKRQASASSCAEIAMAISMASTTSADIEHSPSLPNLHGE